jgi:hypothetical protein
MFVGSAADACQLNIIPKHVFQSIAALIDLIQFDIRGLS